MMVHLTPLNNLRNTECVMQKECEYQESLSCQVRQEEEEVEQNSPSARMSTADRMRFALLLCIDELYKAYL